ncbi:MAG TPA: hypothetical protein VGH76_26280 [Actinomycetospora sp.]|jgi:hypothetical protein|uniref:hypothetical protein n=1 Tax=Actinomycetospora sp. TaxID=1872135 RepID=UPI002F42985A
MANGKLNPRDWRDVQVLRAQGVLAELLVVDLAQAGHGLRAYADAAEIPLHEVARQVCDLDLIIDRELCISERQQPGPAGTDSTTQVRPHTDGGKPHRDRVVRPPMNGCPQAWCAELLNRSEVVIELTRKSYRRLAETAEALAETYDRIADTREANSRAAGITSPGERVRITRRRADAERRDAQQLRRAAEGSHDTDEERGRS